MKLQTKDLTRRYGKMTALDGLTLTIESGECCLLLGPNGSGKTTLMKLIAGLVQPTSGGILLDGEALSVSHRAQIAYMPTENYFYHYMSVRDAGRYYADFFSDFDFEAYASRIERAELSMNASIRALSSGMSAKLRLALILSRDARIMLFDEPINGVDMLTRDWVLTEIAARRSAERILLISTHLVEQASSIASRAIFLKHGALVADEDMASLLEAHALEERYREIYAGREAAVC